MSVNVWEVDGKISLVTSNVVDKAEAVLIEPTLGAIMYIHSEDGRGNLWKAVVGASAGTYSDDGGSYCGAQFIPTGGDGSSAWLRDYQSDVNVRWFGAKGDNVDDTVAINNAVAFAQLLKAELLFPEGIYVTTGITLGVTNVSCILKGINYTWGAGNNGAKIILKDGTNGNLITADEAGGPSHYFENIVLDGNKDNNTAGTVVYVKERAAADTRFLGSVKMTNVTIQNGAVGGLYIGADRGATLLRSVRIADNGTAASHHGLYINTYDIQMQDCHIGANAGYGLYLEYTHQLHMYGVNIFHNKGGGLFVGKRVTWFNYFGGQLDQNHLNTIYIEEHIFSPSRNTKNFSGLLLVKHDDSIVDGDSLVFVDGASTECVFTSCVFAGSHNYPTNPLRPNYGFEFNSVNARVQVIGSRNEPDGFELDYTNNYKCLGVAVNKSKHEVPLDLDSVIEGGIFAGGFYNQATVKSDVTSAAYANRTFLNTEDASFTVTSVIGHQVEADTIEAASTVTHLRAYSATNIVGGVNNYGFYSNLNIGGGTGDWSFYGVGTAPSYFTGTIASLGSYNSTTASAANTFIASTGLIQRSTSSAVYKTQIETLEHSYSNALLNEVRPVWYRSLCEGDNKSWSWYGFIAEEIAAIDPRLVHWGHPMKKVEEVINEETGKTHIVDRPDTEAPLVSEGIMYDRMVVMLFDIVQRQEKRIAALEAD